MVEDQIRPADLTRHHEDRLLKGERRQKCSRRSGAQADLPRLLRGRLDGADEPHMNGGYVLRDIVDTMCPSGLCRLPRRKPRFMR